MVRFFHYKPVGLIQSKWKSVAESRLQGPSSSGLLLPQAILSIAWASVVPSIVAGVELLLRTCILPSYPQGWDRFTSPSVCKLCGCNGINYSQGKVRGFLCTKVSQTDTYIIHLLDTGHSGIRDSLITHTLGYHNPPRRYENSPFSYLNCTLAGKHH